MAESEKQKCSNCKKMGMIRCDGCDQRFCSPHFNNHRHHLDTLFEQICHDRDSLCENINNLRLASSSNHPQLFSFLSEINEWESKTLKMVEQTADRARQQINELMNVNNKAAEDELDKLSKELRRRKEDDDYFEQDIEKLSKQLEQIRIDFSTHVPHIRINMMPIDWSTVVQVINEMPKHSIVQQKRNQFVGGTLLTADHQVQLGRFYGNEDQKWQLIYKATKNGFDSHIFHQFCDKQGPTLTVIQSSERYLFGGYTAASWDIYNARWMVDKTAFLFTLINPHNIPPTKYKINSAGTNAICSCFVNGPIFGKWNIYIYLEKNRNNESSINFPANYIDSTGRGNLTFTGSEQFSITDIEIYRFTLN